VPIRANRLADNYSPLYFLASLGVGGLTVTFFMYLMLWVPHKGRPIPIFEGILEAFQTGTPPVKLASLVAVVRLSIFAFITVKMLI
jgi:hypothetical protein